MTLVNPYSFTNPIDCKSKYPYFLIPNSPSLPNHPTHLLPRISIMPDIPSLLPQLLRHPAPPAILSSAALARLGIKDPNVTGAGVGIGGRNGVGREWHLRDEDWAGNGIYFEGVGGEGGRMLILYRSKCSPVKLCGTYIPGLADSDIYVLFADPELAKQNTKCWIINCGNAFHPKHEQDKIIPCTVTQRVVPEMGESGVILCSAGEGRRRVWNACGEGEGEGEVEGGGGVVCKGVSGFIFV